MKNAFQKSTVVAIFIVLQSLFISAAQANGRGMFLDGRGESQAGPGELVRCPLFDENGASVGEYFTILSGGTITHTIELHNGTMTVTTPANADLMRMEPVTAEVATAFPELAGYVGTGHQIMTVVANHTIDDSWVTTGSLSPMNEVEIRCVYLVAPDKHLSKCLGCHIFFYI